MSRCSGTSVTIIGHSEDGSKTRIRLPSGMFLSLNLFKDKEKPLAELAEPPSDLLREDKELINPS